MPNPVQHFEIAVRDDFKAREFYGKMFDWSFTVNEQFNYTEIAPAGERSIGGGLFKIDEGKMPPYVAFYVTVDDINAALAKSESLGGRTVVPFTPIPGVGAIGMFADPDGNVIGIFSTERQGGQG